MNYNLSDENECNATALAVIDDNQPPTDDGFEAGAAEADQRLIQGHVVKFADGFWKLNGQLIDKNREFVAVAMKQCWIRWESNRPAEYRWPRPSGLLQARETLGYEDRTKWPAGLDGNPRDPWQCTRHIYLASPESGSINTYVGTTMGARMCYVDLAAAVRNMRKSHPGVLAVVRLSCIEMKTKIGTKMRPHFEIVDWKQTTDDAPTVAAIAPPVKQPEVITVGTKPVSPKTGSDMDDDIPFAPEFR